MAIFAKFAATSKSNISAVSDLPGRCQFHLIHDTRLLRISRCFAAIYQYIGFSVAATGKPTGRGIALQRETG